MQFYALMNGMQRGALRFDAVERDLDAQRLLLGEYRPETPIVFEHDSGKSAGDLMGETYGKLYIVSPAFVSVLTENGFTGWGTFPVHLNFAEKTWEGYVGLAVTGRSGPIDRSRSQVVERITRGKKRRGVMYAEIGLFIDFDTWDGSDVFVPAGSSIVCITERVKSALESAGITNARFIPNEQYELGLHASKRF